MSANNNKGTYYITTPIYYPSSDLHIGHTYCTVMADAMARFKRLQGYDVRFQTGTDEHGQKIQKKAEANGVTPQAYVDDVVSRILKLWETMEISYDDFVRTTEPRHTKRVQEIFMKMYEKGDIYKSQYEGLYCTDCEAFWTESQLVDGKCPDCGRAVEPAHEEAYFFKLSKYGDKLLKLYDERPEFLEPESRRNEMRAFINQGLEDLCISRTSFDWGIPVPIDEKHVIYVWLDALSNYITTLGYPDDKAEYNKYWPADVHLVGKEIVRFHSIIWPAMLMSMDEPLPKQVLGHGWLLIDGGKMSKSKGNVVSPEEIINKYGADTARLFILFAAPPEKELEWSDQGVEGSYRFINRVYRLVSEFIEKYGTDIDTSKIEAVTDEDKQLNYVLNSTISRVTEDTNGRFNFNTDISAIMELINELYKYKELNRLNKELYAFAIEKAVIILSPFAPHLCEELWEALGHEGSIGDEPWPSFDESALIKSTVEIVIQVNGKLKTKMDIPGDFGREEMEKLVSESDEIKEIIADKNILKIIAVPGRLINIVVK